MTIDVALKQWAQWMQAAGLADSTIRFRAQTLSLMARRTGADPRTCDWRPLSAFLADVGLAAVTKANYYAALKSWFDYLILTDQRVDQPMRKIKKAKAPRRLPRPYATEKLARLLSTGMYRKTRMQILLCAYAGFRAHETAKMRGEHIDGPWLIVKGKGGVEARVPLHPAIAEYAAHFPVRGLWFPSPSNPDKSISPKSVGRNISHAMRRAGFPAVSHQLRHWFGTENLEINPNIRVVQQVMRHASITSTAIYTLIGGETELATVIALPVPDHTPRSRAGATIAA